MKLCIAEKPSVGKELARILGANSRKDGYFEGKEYCVSWTFGHLCTLKAPDDYTPEWKWWRFSSLPMIPPKFQIKVMDDEGVKKQFNTLKTLIEKCDEVINCGDAGMEGELIQRWVLSLAQCNKPVKRLWISSMTDEAIKEGFEKLRSGADFDSLYAAGNARAIGDWLLGMNASRLYTLKYANKKGVLSIGRVQTPTLALIVNRYKEIQNFKPETYWELKTNYRNVIFNSTQRKFAKQDEAQKILEIICDKEFYIVSSTKKKATEHPPALFDLTSLQVECNKKFNFTADETLQYIQKLYESKLVTYPRVDTTYLPNDMYPKCQGILKGMKPYAKFTEPVLKGTLRKSKKVFDDSKITDHHAIVPTGVDPSGGLLLQEKQVYDLIAKRFIAAFYPDCELSNTTVIGDVDGYEFTATGKVILVQGWRELYPKKDDDKKNDEEQEMPEFVKGEHGPHIPDLQEKQTQPPKMHTEATLLRAMETAGKQVDDAELRELMKENGIGRPSTRANIIETLFKRKYIVRQKKNLIPTVTGIELIDTIQNELLKSVELTGIWEKKLRQIEKAEYDVTVFLDEMKKMVTDLVVEVKSETAKAITIEEDNRVAAPKKEEEKAEVAKNADNKSIETICPKCKKGRIVNGKSAYGCTAFSEGCHFKIDFELFGKALTEKQILSLVTKGKTPKIKGLKTPTGLLDGNIVLNKDFTFAVQADDKKTEKTKPEKTEENAKPDKKEEALKCPKCGQGTMLKGNSAWGCSQFRDGCRFLIPFDSLLANYGSTELTKEILKRHGSSTPGLF